MRNRNLVSQLNSLQLLLVRTEAATGGDIELMGHWGRYLCVLTAGFLENSLKEVYKAFVINAASPQVAKFAIARLEGISNPKSGRFIDTAASFNQAWATELRAFLNEDGERRRNAIDSVMNNRHQIAHGGDGGQISVGRIREYLPSCVEVVEFLEKQLSGPATA